MIMGVTNIVLCMCLRKQSTLPLADFHSSQRSLPIFGRFHDSRKADRCYGVQGLQHDYAGTSVSYPDTLGLIKLTIQ